MKTFIHKYSKRLKTGLMTLMILLTFIATLPEAVAQKNIIRRGQQQATTGGKIVRNTPICRYPIRSRHGGQPRGQTGVNSDGGQGIATQQGTTTIVDHASTDAKAKEYLDLGLDYYYGTGGKSQDYDLSYQNIRKGAELGNTDAQAMLGYFYRKGIGCKADDRTAVQWYRQAANRGNATALNNLGFCYENGYGVTADGNEALAYYTRAAEQNYAVAQRNLAYCYQNAIGINAPNLAEAGRWFRKAAANGDEQAQEEVDKLDEAANPTMELASKALGEKKYELAYGYLTAAANMGSDIAQAILGDMTVNGIGTTANYSTGIKWLEMAADQNNSIALNYLGEYYERGQAGLSRNASRAFAYYSAAHEADEDDEDAAYNLARCYRDGIGCSVNRSKAIELFQLAADAGSDDASEALSDMGAGSRSNTSSSSTAANGSKRLADYNSLSSYEKVGIAVSFLLGEDGYDEDPDFGFKLLKQGVDEGNEIGMNIMSLCYSIGLGCEQSDAKRFYWAQRSAELGYSGGQVSLGKCYENGIGTSTDLQKARYWYQKAADQDNEDAIEALENLNSASTPSSPVINTENGGSMFDAIDDI